MSSDYVEYKGREKEEVSPKVTNPDQSRASVEQLLRGLLSANFISGSNGYQTGSIIIARDGPSGSLESIFRQGNAIQSAEQFRPAYEDPANGVAATEKSLVTSGDYAPDTYRSSGSLENSVQLKSSEGVVVEVAGRVDESISNGNYFLQIYNDASGSNAPIWSRKLVHTNGTDTNFDLEFNDYPMYCANSIEIAVSTTEDSYTAPATGSARFRARYK